jgi:rhodanese-related sulfurtransferase
MGQRTSCHKISDVYSIHWEEAEDEPDQIDGIEEHYEVVVSHPTLLMSPANKLKKSFPLTAYETSSKTRFQQIPHTVPLAAGVDRLDPITVQQLLETGQCILVDVRGDDRSAGTVEGAVHVPAIGGVPFAIRIQEYVRQWAEQPLIVFHCQYSAHRAPQSANDYRKQAPDHQLVAIMDGGFRGWESSGLPVEGGMQGLGVQQHSNAYALQQGMQLALSAQQSARFH